MLPAVPVNFIAKANEFGSSIALSWQDGASNSGRVSYRLERSTNQKDWHVLNDNRSDKLYIDSDVQYRTRYFYRVRATDEAGNHSGYAVTEATTPAFLGNASPDKDTVLTAELYRAEVIIPAGALPEPAACSIEPADLESTDYTLDGHQIISGPLQVLCRVADTTAITKFNKPLSVTWTVDPPKKVAGALKYYGYDDELIELDATSDESQAHTVNFLLDRGTTFVAVGKYKQIPLWIKLVGTLLGLGAMAVGGMVWLGRRTRDQLHQRNEDYRKKMMGG